MFRVITKYQDGGTRPIVEYGPWHESEDIAHFWAQSLKKQGYIVEVENQNKDAPQKEATPNDNADLAAALASMA